MSDIDNLQKRILQLEMALVEIISYCSCSDVPGYLPGTCKDVAEKALRDACVPVDRAA